MTSNFPTETDPINGVKASTLSTVLFDGVEWTKLLGNASNATTGTWLNEAYSETLRNIFKIESLYIYIRSWINTFLNFHYINCHYINCSLIKFRVSLQKNKTITQD